MSPSTPDPGIHDRLALAPDGTPRVRVRRWLWLALGVGAVAVGAAAVVWAVRATPATYETAPVQAGALQVTVPAVGQVEPRRDVDVSSETSGIVAAVHVDTSDRVAAGQTLAELDATLLRAQVDQARAQLRSARASLEQAKVIAAEARTALLRADQLGASVLSTEQLDTARYAAARAEAARDVAAAQVDAASAALHIAEATLDKTFVRSPLDGIVLERHVEPGQAVISSLQASTLFRIAADLERMIVRVEIDEADIGRVVPGLDATFTVSAFPSRVFEASVSKVEPAPTSVGNVVTYGAELEVDNADSALLPGMTATASIVAGVHDQELLVPAAALRFSPEDAEPSTATRVWLLRGDQPVAVEVVRIAGDADQVAVASDALHAGDLVITGRVEE